MADTEQIVSELFVALRSVQLMLVGGSSNLRAEQGWSEVTHVLEVSEISDGSDRRVGFWGYIDGEKEGVGGFGWIFDVLHDGRTWTVDRKLVLNAGGAGYTGYQETVAELPSIAGVNSPELARVMPGLVQELLELPATDPYARG